MIKYKEYLTGEEPEKKKEQSAVGATTPTTPPVLTYEGFVGTGTGSNAYQQGVKYAQGVKDSIYGSAKALREQTEENIKNARQSGIVDSRSSYQKAVGTYGAKAESLGKMGLTESGYGEYLTADAYATHRGNVQDINAQALAANREAENLEAQTKAAADSEYLKNLYSLGTKFDAAKDAAYNDIITAISKGTSLDIIKQSGAWGDLTPEQQTAIESESNKVTNTNAVRDMIDSGASLEDIQNSDEYKNLDDTTKAEVDKIVGQQEEQKQATVDYIYEEAVGSEVSTSKDLQSFLNSYTDAGGHLLSNETKEAVINKWTTANVDNDIASIKEATFEDGKLVVDGVEITGEMIAKDIKNGVYGDNAQAVVDAYGEALINNAQKSGSIGDAIYAKEQLERLGDAAKSWVSKIDAKVKVVGVNSIGYDGSAFKVDGKRYKGLAGVYDAKLTKALNSLTTSSAAALVQFNGKYYLRLKASGMWTQVEPVS